MWEFKFLQILYPQDTFAWALWFNHMQFGTLCLNAIKLKGLHMLCVLQYFCSNFSQRYFSTNHQSLFPYYFIPFHAKKCIGKPIVLFVLFLFTLKQSWFYCKHAAKQSNWSCNNWVQTISSKIKLINLNIIAVDAKTEWRGQKTKTGWLNK